MASYDDVAYVVTVPSSVSGVIFDGLMVNGDNPLTTSPFTANGANPDADEGISITGDGAIVRNCVVKNIFQFGISMGATSAASARFGEVTDNYLENIPYWAAILAYDSYYAEVSGNTIVNAWRGVQADNHYLAVPEVRPRRFRTTRSRRAFRRSLATRPTRTTTAFCTTCSTAPQCGRSRTTRSRTLRC